MLSDKVRFYNTICTIEYAENYEENIELFDKAATILKDRLAAEDFSEFSDDEREILEEALPLALEGED